MRNIAEQMVEKLDLICFFHLLIVFQLFCHVKNNPESKKEYTISVVLSKMKS